MASCAERLEEAQDALHTLLLGGQVAKVGYGERRIEYTAANIEQLRAYVKQLEAECGDPATVRRPIRGVF